MFRGVEAIERRHPAWLRSGHHIIPQPWPDAEMVMRHPNTSASRSTASTSFFGWRRRGMLPQYNALLAYGNRRREVGPCPTAGSALDRRDQRLYVRIT